MLLHNRLELAVVWSVLLALVAIVVFRGLVDVLAHRLIPAPTIYGAEYELADDDVISRRRLWYWRKKFRRALAPGRVGDRPRVVDRSCIAIFQGEGRRRGDALGDVLTAIARRSSLGAAADRYLIVAVPRSTS